MKKNKIKNLVRLGGFYDGFAEFYVSKDQTTKVGLMNQNGDIIISPIYYNIFWSSKYIGRSGDFQNEGRYYTRYYKGLENIVDVVIEIDNKTWEMESGICKMLDIMSGKMIDEKYAYPSGGGGFHIFGEGGSEAIINADGDIIIPYNYRTLVWCETFYIAEDLTGKWGLLNATGEIILPFLYDCMYYEAKHSNLPYAPELCELIPVRQGERRFYINPAGVQMSLCYYDYIEPFSNNMHAVFGIKKNGIMKYGVIDNKENIVVPPKYNNCTLLDDRYVRVEGDASRLGMTEYDSLYGVIDLCDKVVLPIQYDWITLAPNHTFIVVMTNLNGRWGGDYQVGVVRSIEVSNYLTAPALTALIDDPELQKSNKIQTIVPFEYMEIGVCDSVYVAKQAESKRWGILSLDGDVIAPFVYDDINYSGTSDFIPVKQNGEWFYINLHNERVLF